MAAAAANHVPARCQPKSHGVFPPLRLSLPEKDVAQTFRAMKGCIDMRQVYHKLVGIVRRNKESTIGAVYGLTTNLVKFVVVESAGLNESQAGGVALAEVLAIFVVDDAAGLMA